MKTIKSTKLLAVSVAALTAATAFQASADQPATAARPENHYTGKVVAVNAADHTLTAKGFVFSKKFNLGSGCTYALLDKNPGTAADLRPGEKVTVSYQDAQGVLVADRVQQQPMRMDGMVRSIDPIAHTMTLQVHGMDRKMRIANGCMVELRDNNSGALNNIQTGNHVTVTYETPDGKLTARQISQTSALFTGTLTAIDLQERTVKASSFMDTKKFNLADNCTIVINGKPDGKLSELRPDEKLDFSYDPVNGVNVVNRIATVPAEGGQNKSVASTNPMSGD